METHRLEMKNISIEFPGVKALSNVDFEVQSGEVRAVVGANGAGKSTLMKVLSGAYGHYTGEIFMDGQKCEIRSPLAAKELGIEIVYQEVDTALFPYLSVAENIMFSSLVTKMKGQVVVSWPKIRQAAKEVLDRLHMSIDVNRQVSELSLAQKQMVLIARAVRERCRFLILDEPTAPLSLSEVDELFRVVKELSEKENVGVIFISHRLPELFRICKSVTVMRDGRLVKNMAIDESTTIEDIVRLMLGRTLEEALPKRSAKPGDVLLEAQDLSDARGKVRNVSFQVRSGEIVGISGLVGAGKTELSKLLFGAARRSSGIVKRAGRMIAVTSPTVAVRERIALVPEERRKEGVLVDEPVYSNLSIACLDKFVNRFSFVNRRAELEAAHRLIGDLGIKTPSEFQKGKFLSGGNQQKVVIGKWLACDSDIYIMDEPTKGIDVGAKYDVYRLIRNLADAGKAILYISSEISEILSVTDRTYIMCNGEIVKELKTEETTEEEILYYSTGGKGRLSHAVNT